MRSLDIAAGASVAIISIAILATVNPVQLRAQSDDLTERSRTRDAILRFVENVGFRWFVSSSTSEICTRLAKLDSSVSIDVSIDGVQCFPHGGMHFGYASLSFMLGNLEVKLEGWARDARA